MTSFIRAAALQGMTLSISACGGPASVPRVVPAAGAPAGMIMMPASPVAAYSLPALLKEWRARAAGAPATLDIGGDPRLELMRLEAEAGNYDEALRQADLLNGIDADSTAVAPYPTGGWSPADAMTAIADLAAHRRVVMINEAHHVPQHRAFTISLLRALRAKGFTWLAVETLSDADSLLASRGYPLPTSGPYLNEPVYGDLVRTALALGYHVVAYEGLQATGPGGREQAQADNLVRRVMRKDPAARLLVHAGYRHVNKGGLLAGVAPMAVAFRRATGIDPLSVDQTMMTEHGAPVFEHPYYRQAAPGLTGPTVFRDAQGRPWTLDPQLRDVTVFHPRTRLEGGRPTWLRLGGTRTLVPLDATPCGAAMSCLVEARWSTEQPDAVPVDRVEVKPGAPLPMLMLPRGEFVVRSTTSDGRVARETRVSTGVR